jgi:hypothetical protein
MIIARFVTWGREGIGFWSGRRGDTNARLRFEVPFPQFATDATLTENERRFYRAACLDWQWFGAVPTGAQVPLAQAHHYGKPITVTLRRAADMLRAVGWQPEAA